MSTINTNINSSIWGVQSNNQTIAAQTQTQPRVHHHHHKNSSQDSVQISKDGQQEVNKPKGPLDDLVSNGTITQDQEDAIRNAFMSAREASKSGTYTSNPTSPLTSLVTNNTITQAQADSITSAFKARTQSADGTNTPQGVEGHHRTHHHHHNNQQVQDIADPNETVTHTTGTTDSVVNEILETAENQAAAAQSQDQQE